MTQSRQKVLLVCLGLLLMFADYGCSDQALEEESWDRPEKIVVRKKTPGRSRVRRIVTSKTGPIRSHVEYRRYDPRTNKFFDLRNFDQIETEDKFLVAITNSRPSYVYILGVDASGKLNILFPSKDIRIKNPLVGNKRVILPPDTEKKNLAYGFEPFEGIETLYTFVSPKPHPFLEKLIKKVSENGLILTGKNASLKQKLQRTYAQGSRGISKDPDFRDTYWFTKLYAKKLMLLHGEGTRILSSRRGMPIRSWGFYLFYGGRFYPFITDEQGNFFINAGYDHTSGLMILSYHGEILEHYMTFSKQPTRYKLFIKLVRNRRNAKPYLTLRVEQF
ncbi:MAG TPA: DUF4384 domain-containing protein [Spirochaetes bacterium]|nr:DUF4384 domain-containing protein [Spirochaetota bacterium]